MIKVLELHLPTRLIVISSAPASFMAIAPPARRLWEEIRDALYPLSYRPSCKAAHRTAVLISLSETTTTFPLQLIAVPKFAHPELVMEWTACT